MPSTTGNLTIPRTVGSILLHGRDSKIQVVDYHLGNGPKILYSITEIFTWYSDRLSNQTVLVVYNSPNKKHGIVFASNSLPTP